MRLFQSRQAAAHELARLLAYLKTDKPVVLGLVNGGVPMAEIIAQELDAPLDVLMIDRLSAPKHPGHIVGAVDEHGRISMIQSTARWHHLTSQQMVEPAREAFRQLSRRRAKVRALLPEMDVRNRTVIIVSQGVATGAKMLGAIASVRDRGARKVVAAAPAGSGEATWQLHEAADLVVVPHRPSRFKSVAEFYDEFSPVPDELVLAIIERWVQSRPQQDEGVKTLLMKVTNDLGHLLCAEIDLPPGTTRGSGPYPCVLFSHGHESDGRNPRTIPISRRIAKRGLIGVRVDYTGHGRSEGELEHATPEQTLKDLQLFVDHVGQLEEVDEHRIGFVGSGSGSQTCLTLAKDNPAVRAIVVRGPMQGREIESAMSVTAPTLLIYAERDIEFTDSDRETARRLPSFHQILEIPEATRFFNDAISREMMVGATVDWIVDHLASLPGEDGPTSAPADEAVDGR